MLNQVVLVGRLTSDMEVKESEDGKKYCNMSLAIPRSFKNADGVYDTDFVSIKTFDTIAQNTAEYCNKGDIVGVKGRIQTGSYEKDGRTIYTTDVVADSVQFLESKAQSENRMTSDNSDFSQVTPQDFVNQEVKESDMSDEVFANFGDSIEISDDDIAF